MMISIAATERSNLLPRIGEDEDDNYNMNDNIQRQERRRQRRLTRIGVVCLVSVVYIAVTSYRNNNNNNNNINDNNNIRGRSRTYPKNTNDESDDDESSSSIWIVSHDRRRRRRHQPQPHKQELIKQQKEEETDEQEVTTTTTTKQQQMTLFDTSSVVSSLRMQQMEFSGIMFQQWDQWKDEHIIANVHPLLAWWWPQIGHHHHHHHNKTLGETTDSAESSSAATAPSAWYSQAWTRNAELAHSVYRQTQQHRFHFRGDATHKLDTWDTLMAHQQERTWYHDTILKLHHFHKQLVEGIGSGDTSNYTTTTDNNHHHQQNLFEHRFSTWWNHPQTSAQAKQRWNQTQSLYQHWMMMTEETTAQTQQYNSSLGDLWWNVTQTIATSATAATTIKEQSTTTLAPSISLSNVSNDWNMATTAARDWWHRHAMAAVSVPTTSTTTTQHHDGEHHPHHRVLHDAGSATTTAATVTPSAVLYFNSSKAYRYLLLEEDNNDDDSLTSFFSMAVSGGWDAQINQAYCGVASAAAVLNAVFSDTKGVAVAETTATDIKQHQLPIDPRYQPYHYATQLDLLLPHYSVSQQQQQDDQDHDHHPATVARCIQDHVIRYNASYDGIFHAPGGLSLQQVKALLECHTNSYNSDDDGSSSSRDDSASNDNNEGDAWSLSSSSSSSTTKVTITATHVTPDVSVDDLRHNLRAALAGGSGRGAVLINYHRAAIAGQVGGGHFSPLGAYSVPLDSFLLLDVAKYKYPPVWVPTPLLYQAMQTVDLCGQWDFPNGQDRVDTTLHIGGGSSFTREDYFKLLLEQLNCQPRYRGYITVTKDNDNNDK